MIRTQEEGGNHATYRGDVAEAGYAPGLKFYAFGCYCASEVFYLQDLKRLIVSETMRPAAKMRDEGRLGQASRIGNVVLRGTWFIKNPCLWPGGEVQIF